MLQIKSIPAFDDNYIWLIQNRDRDCAVVDPGSAEPVLAYLKQHDLNLKSRADHPSPSRPYWRRC
ncbi:hypothetical protein WI845_14205 [Vibrio cholerae]